MLLIPELHKYAINVLVFKVINSQSPIKIWEMLGLKPHYHLIRRSHNLFVHQVRTNIGKFNFRYNGVIQWNNLPDNIKTLSSIVALKKQVKHRLMNSHT